MTGIIDYGAGNLLSVANAVKFLGFDSVLVSKPEHFEGVTKLILPGVGAFGDCVENLQAQGLWAPIQEWLRAGKPYFGICLGYQVLFESSAESPNLPGLGVLEGEVVEFSAKAGDKVPHMGWNSIGIADLFLPIWNGLNDGDHVYFVHSFYPEPQDQSIVAARTHYAGVEFAAAVCKGALWATQFHPERSQQVGLQVVRNFIEAY